MNRKRKTANFVVLLIFFGIILTFFALERATDINFAEKSEEENAARILKWNFKRCPKIIYTGSEYGEGIIAVKCSNYKAYTLYHISGQLHSSTHLDSLLGFIDVYGWRIEEVDFQYLKNKIQIDATVLTKNDANY